MPFNIAALPDLIARAAMFAITSGRASKMMSRTPIGQVILSKTKPSSRSVFKVSLPTEAYGTQESQGPQLAKIFAGFVHCRLLVAHTQYCCGSVLSVSPLYA